MDCKNSKTAKESRNSKKLMHVAFVLPYLAERFGGPTCVVKECGKCLSRLGTEVSYWAPGDQKDRQEVSSIDKAHVYDLSWPRSWFRSKDMVKGLLSNIDSIDIMHINGFWPHPVLASSRIAYSNDTPYMLQPAGNLRPWLLNHGILKPLKKKLYLALVNNKVMANSACLHATSLQEVDGFCGIGYKGPITVIPNGVDTDVFCPGNSADIYVRWPQLRDRTVVLFMSRLSPEKGLDQLIPAWSKITKHRSHKDAILVIAGSDNRGYRKTVSNMIDRCGVSSKILLMGMLQGVEKLAMLRRADVFILPSYSENFGIVVAEALACQTPVVTTTATPWQQLEDVDAGRCVPPSELELAEAVRELLDMSESRRAAMGSRGRELITQNYTWDIVVRKLITVYKCILHGKEIPFYPEPTFVEL